MRTTRFHDNCNTIFIDSIRPFSRYTGLEVQRREEGHHQCCCFPCSDCDKKILRPASLPAQATGSATNSFHSRPTKTCRRRRQRHHEYCNNSRLTNLTNDTTLKQWQRPTPLLELLFRAPLSRPRPSHPAQLLPPSQNHTKTRQTRPPCIGTEVATQKSKHSHATNAVRCGAAGLARLQP